MRKFATIWLVACPLVVAGPLASQEVNDGEESKHLLALGFADGPEVGIWRQLTSGRQIGIDLEIHVNFTSENSFRALTAIAAPGLKHFVGNRIGGLRTYLYGGVPISLIRARQIHDPGTGEVEVDQWQWGAGLILGIGVDARIVDGLEVGGHVGLQGRYLEDGRRDDGVEVEDRWVAGIHTYTSGVRVQLHF